MRKCKHIKKLIRDLSKKGIESESESEIESESERRRWREVTIKPEVMLYSKDRELIKDGWLCSEKLDGVRGFYDGSMMISRGGKIIDIPERIKLQLGGAYGVDGEFYREGPLQEIIEATQSHRNAREWRGIRFVVFDLRIEGPYIKRYQQIQRMFPDYCIQEAINKEDVDTILDRTVDDGGEGLVVRDPLGWYMRGRTRGVVKVKPVYFGTAGYLGGGWFSESQDDTPFKMLGRAQYVTNVGDIVPFRYSGRTTGNKPQYPVLARSNDGAL